MREERNSGKLELDPRIAGLRRNLTQKITHNLLVPKLIEAQLIDREGKVKKPMTDEGLKELLRNVTHGVNVALSQSKLDIPKDTLVDEIRLSENVINGLGEANLNIEENHLLIKFSGEKPIIISIRSPLKIDNSSSEGSGKPDSFVDFTPFRISE